MSERDPAQANAAKQELEALFAQMGINVTVAIGGDDDERVLLEVDGEDSGFVIGKKGQTLDAVQYVLNRISAGRKLVDRPIHVDAAGYRGRRAESLTELAKRLADEARSSRRPIRADPMTAQDRRVMHVALADEADLETYSEGDEPMRRVVVALRTP